MKIMRRDFWKSMLGIGAVITGSHSVEIESVDPEDCILVVDIHDDLTEQEKARIYDSLRKWKVEYPQLKNLPILVVDKGADIKIIRRKGTSRI